MCEKERQADRVREELLAHLKREQVEPPARDRIRRVIGTALRQAEQALTTRIVAPKVLAGWRARVAAEAPSHLRSHPPEVINARADTKVTKDLVAELKRVTHLGEANVSANVIMAKTGHKSLRPVQRYVKPGLAALHAATETLSSPRRRG